MLSEVRSWFSWPINLNKTWDLYTCNVHILQSKTLIVWRKMTLCTQLVVLFWPFSYPSAGNPYPVSSQQGGYPRMPFPQRPQQTVPTGNHPQVQAANKLCSGIFIHCVLSVVTYGNVCTWLVFWKPFLCIVDYLYAWWNWKSIFPWKIH